MNNEEKIKKVSIIVSRGSLEGVYPGLIMANGARMEGIEANLFFTFFGLHAIVKRKMDHMKIATVGNPALCVPTAMGPGMPTWLGGIPGMSWIATKMMKQEMEKIDIPPVGEFIEMIHDAGCQIYAMQGHRRHVQADEAGLLRTGGQSPHGRRILRGIGGSPNYLHLGRTCHWRRVKY